MQDFGRSNIQAVNMMDLQETKWTLFAHIVKVNTWTRGTLYHLSQSHVEDSVVPTGFLRSMIHICIRSITHMFTVKLFYLQAFMFIHSQNGDKQLL